MFEDTLELAENKLLLLYIFKKIKFPISDNAITEIILQNDFINYFTMKQYLNELLSSNFISHINETDNHNLVITEKGLKVLCLFKNRISKDKLNIIDNYLEKQNKDIKEHLSINTHVLKDKNNFIVDLKISEKDSILMEIKLNVDSHEKAEELCKKWEKNFSELYQKIVESLMEK